MKKLIYVVALALLTTTGSFAQKSNIKAAEKLTKASTPNFVEARRLAKEALAHEETKADAYAWYVAGLVEHEEFRKNLIASALPQNQVDEIAMFNLLLTEMPLFLQVYEIEKVPNEKGKVKLKYTKKVKDHVKEDYQYLLNAGNAYMGKQDYVSAAKAFGQFLKIKEHPLFAEDKEVSTPDSTTMQVAYFACLLNYESKRFDEAIEMSRKYRDFVEKKDDVMQVLCGSLLAKADTTAAVETMMEGAKLFPQTPYYLSNAIAIKMSQGNNDEAVKLLQQAIDNDPNNALYLSMMGDMFTRDEQWEKAAEWYEKSIAIKPDGYPTTHNLGLSYYNMAVKVLSVDRPGKLEEDKAEALFKKALPHFEAAYKQKPDAVYYVLANICKRLGLDKRYQELKELHNLD